MHLPESYDRQIETIVVLLVVSKYLVSFLANDGGNLDSVSCRWLIAGIIVYERERRKMSSIILYKVVQKIKYDRLFFRFCFTRLDVGDGMLASKQLEFQIAIIAEKCLSQCSFFTPPTHDSICHHHILYIYIYDLRLQASFAFFLDLLIS